MGVDSKYKELTDFGGMIEKNESICETANRELVEESVTVFDLRDISKDIASVIMRSPCVIYTTKGPRGRDLIDMCTVFVDFTTVASKASFSFPFGLNDKFQENAEKIGDGVRSGEIVNGAAFLENQTSYWIPNTEFAEVVRKRTPNIVTKKKFHNSFIQTQFSPLFMVSSKPATHPYMYEKVRISICPHFFDLIKQIY